MLAQGLLRSINAAHTRHFTAIPKLLRLHGLLCQSPLLSEAGIVAGPVLVFFLLAKN